VTQLQNDYNELRNQIDGLVADASYRGVNLLQSGTLTTTFNEDRSNKLVTEGVDFTASGLGISKGSFTNEASVDSSISQLRNAKTAARSFGESIANDLAIIQTREGFTKSTINTLETGADKLTLADQNEEGARMLALQTRQQIGFVSLSLASQASQGILRLF
jgi:flagellin